MLGGGRRGSGLPSEAFQKGKNRMARPVNLRPGRPGAKEGNRDPGEFLKDCNLPSNTYVESDPIPFIFLPFGE